MITLIATSTTCDFCTQTATSYGMDTAEYNLEVTQDRGSWRNPTNTGMLQEQSADDENCDYYK